VLGDGVGESIPYRAREGQGRVAKGIRRANAGANAVAALNALFLVNGGDILERDGIHGTINETTTTSCAEIGIYFH
jgi:hypothetical protein